LSVQVIDLALVQALVCFAHLAQIQRGLTKAAHSILVTLGHVRRITSVPNVDGQLVRIFEPIHDKRFLLSVGKLDGTIKDYILANEGAHFGRL